MNEKFLKGFLAGMLCSLFIFTGTMALHEWMQANGSGIGGSLFLQSTSPEEDGKKEVGAVSSKVLAKMAMLEKYMDTYYLKGVDTGKLVDGVYKGLVESLSDPYSVYYNAEEFNSIQESSSGTYCGIGARVSQNAETKVLTIVEPFNNGPAMKAGIKEGDIIYKVNGEEVSDQDISEVVAKMKGKKGTEVKLTVLRDGQEKEFCLLRDEVENPTVSYEMMENRIGYIKISEFDEVTGEQFRSALEDLEKQGEKGLVIDLRNNGGGRLDAVVDMLDRILPKGVIVSTKDKKGEGKTYESTDDEKFDKPMAVLINNYSASASEVFSGAVQDYGIAKLVGTTSFGKGIVQTIFDLGDHTAIKLTTSEYFTPKGRNIHGSGLEPDIRVELDEGAKIGEKKDNQLLRAWEEIDGEVN